MGVSARASARDIYIEGERERCSVNAYIHIHIGIYAHICRVSILVAAAALDCNDDLRADYGLMTNSSVAALFI